MASRRGPDRTVLLRRHPEPPLLPPASALQDRLAAVDHDIQALLLDNQRLAAVHVALRQELLHSRHELRLAAASASRAREAKEAELRDALNRSKHAEAAAARVEAMRAEAAEATDEVRRLSASRDEMVQRLVAMRGDLGRKRAENAGLDLVAKEIDSMRRELQKGQAAIEFERKVRADNQEQGNSMEAHTLSMMREIDKLRAELANTEKRAQAAAANATPGYATASYVNPNPPETAAYASYGDPYNQAQVQRTPDGTTQYVQGTDAQPSYNTQHNTTQR